MISNYLERITSIVIDTSTIEVTITIDICPGLTPIEATAVVHLQNDYIVEHGAGDFLVAALYFLSSGLESDSALDNILFNLEVTTIDEELEDESI